MSAASIDIKTLLQQAPVQLPSDSPRLDAELLLAFVLQKTRTYLYTWPERQVSSQQLQQFHQLLEQRKQGKPVAHLIGEREFWGLPLSVNDSTLIPRPDTETLVETALQLDLPEQARVLDLGTGTGAIALALASEKPAWQISATDLSPAAVALAQSNAQKCQLERVNIQQSDWFSAFDQHSQRFHLIVSNPPYIDPDDHHLQQGDVRFEPLSALIAPDQGLADLRHLIQKAPAFLEDNGWLVLEHGFDQGEAVRAMFSTQGYGRVATQQDLAGNDRITLGCWRPTQA